MRLYRVLIVDDEPYIVHYVQELLDSCSALEMEVSTAYASEEALNMIRQQKFDILISDIRMPGINGLELAKQAKALWPSCLTILLTAHAEFQLAQDAIQVGVASYILKNATDQHVLDEVIRVAALCDASLNPDPMFSQTVSRQTSAHHKQRFFNLLYNRGEFSQHDCQTILSDLRLDPQLPLCLLGGRLCGQYSEETSALHHKVKLLFSRYVANTLNGYACETQGEWILWMFNPSSPSDPSFITRLIDQLEMLTQFCQSSSELAVSFALCYDISSPLEIYRAYERLHTTWKQVIRSQAFLVYAFSCHNNIDSVVPSDNLTIKTIIEYLTTHLFDDVSLQRLSSLTGYNPCYISRLFREQVGKRLKDYIAEKRLEYIAALMYDEQLSLRDISEAVHFENRSYFNRFVKKMTKLTPQEYRASLLQNNPNPNHFQE